MGDPSESSLSTKTNPQSSTLGVQVSTWITSLLADLALGLGLGLGHGERPIGCYLNSFAAALFHASGLRFQEPGHGFFVWPS
jgi:hypothetical protein